jgi:hypothetical protein
MRIGATVVNPLRRNDSPKRVTQAYPNERAAPPPPARWRAKLNKIEVVDRATGKVLLNLGRNDIAKRASRSGDGVAPSRLNWAQGSSASYSCM